MKTKYDLTFNRFVIFLDNTFILVPIRECMTVYGAVAMSKDVELDYLPCCIFAIHCFWIFKFLLSEIPI